jgi:hypothetical protein
MVASAALTVLAFYHIFQQKKDSENDLNVIQRQIRGFALLMVANLVMILGMMLCAGSLFPALTTFLR